ncbi:hypothetical protein [Aeromonas phage vB_ AhaP_PT2]|uniref:Uncharacterized protein n=1 Tax=Aeromonas phage vB_ AhaP_PT2 TaxID=2924715 RepID=A0AC61TTC8_9CAUD|nr:hypothetical protein [Aeromonas phage vB_ AhaP_PT2]
MTMKVITMSEEIGLIWYTANDWRGNEYHVVCYGLEVKHFDNAADVNEHYKGCLNHYWESCGAYDSDE